MARGSLPKGLGLEVSKESLYLQLSVFPAVQDACSQAAVSASKLWCLVPCLPTMMTTDSGPSRTRTIYPKQTLPSINCLGHGALSQQQKSK